MCTWIPGPVLTLVLNANEIIGDFMECRVYSSGSQLPCALEPAAEPGPHHRHSGSVGLSGTHAQDSYVQPRMRIDG